MMQQTQQTKRKRMTDERLWLPIATLARARGVSKQTLATPPTLGFAGLAVSTVSRDRGRQMLVYVPDYDRVRALAERCANATTGATGATPERS
jgi:hypothetical protein